MTKWVNWMLTWPTIAFIYNCSVTTRRKKKSTKKEAALTSDRGHRSGLLFLTAGIADMLLFVMFLSQDSMSMASRFNWKAASMHNNGGLDSSILRLPEATMPFFNFLPLRIWQKRSLQRLVFPIGFFWIEATTFLSSQSLSRSRFWAARKERRLKPP